LSFGERDWSAGIEIAFLGATTPDDREEKELSAYSLISDAR
jgi:hypothetical protein